MPRSFQAFLGATFLSQLGNAAALLAATIVSSDAGRATADSATFTALMLAVNFGTATVATPYTAAIAARVGPRRLYAYTQALGALLYAVVAAGLVAGVPGYPLLLATAPLLGLLGGWPHVVAPLALRAYSGNEDLAAAESQSSIATGFAWVIGGLAGAALVTQVGPPTAFVADFALTVPLVLVVLLVEPGAAIGAVRSSPRPWRDLLGRLRHNPAVSRSAVIGLASAIFISPFASMVVPIARDLQHTLAIHAGLILACIAVGEMLSPAAVRSMSRVGSRVSPTWVAYTIAGLVLIVIGLTVLAFDGGPELVAVAAFGIVYGAVNYGGSSFLIRDAAAESDDANRQADLAAFFLAVGIGVPIGTLLWGQIVHLLSAAHVLMFAGLGMVAFVGALGVLRSEYRHHHHGNDVPEHGTGVPGPHGILRRLGI